LIGGATRGTIQLVDAYCTGQGGQTSIYAIILNKGTSTITTLTWVVDGTTVTADNPSTVAQNDCSNTISPDGSLSCNVTGTAGVINEILVTGPANAVGGSIMCR